jgi:hypothetical protein
MPQKKKLNEFGQEVEIEPLYEPPEFIGDVPPELNTLRKAKKKVAYGALTSGERASMGY